MAGRIRQRIAAVAHDRATARGNLLGTGDSHAGLGHSLSCGGLCDWTAPQAGILVLLSAALPDGGTDDPVAVRGIAEPGLHVWRPDPGRVGADAS